MDISLLAGFANTTGLVDAADVVFDRYQGFCKEAQSRFYDRSWPCEAKDKNGERCVNIKSTHSTKGHQNHEGNIFFAEDARFKLSFQSSFESDKDKKQANDNFLENVHNRLRHHIRSYKSSTIYQHETTHMDLKKAAAATHMNAISRYRKKGQLVNGLASHKTCFCCLASSPAYKLRCGHIICRLCLEDYSDEDPETYNRIVRICPLCGNHSEHDFEMKPPTAGLRVLCLDG